MDMKLKYETQFTMKTNMKLKLKYETQYASKWGKYYCKLCKTIFLLLWIFLNETQLCITF